MVFPNIYLCMVPINHPFFGQVYVHIYKTHNCSSRYHVIKHRNGTQTIIGDEFVRFELVQK